MPLPALTVVPLESDPATVVARVPAGSGVGQLLGPEGRNLLLAPASNLRKWAAAHLGLGGPVARGRRPKTNLVGIATAVGWARTSGPFAQRLLYERLAAPLIPLESRRDLKPAAFLHIDPAERFPRVTVREGGAVAGPGRYGPFPRRRAAEKARNAVNRLFALRPCDFVFEPDPALPVGLACLYAQVRSCAAPCLSRVSEPDYRASAAHAAAWLGDPASRDDAPELISPVVSSAAIARAVVVDPGRREIGLFPVRGGRVLEAAAVTTAPRDLDDAVRRLEWPPPDGPADWFWLAGWIASPKGRRLYVPLAGSDEWDVLVAAVRSSLPHRFAAPPGGDNVGTSRGEA